MNIRERVETFIAELENPSLDLAMAAEVTVTRSDANENHTIVHVFIPHIHEEAEIALAIERFLMDMVKLQPRDIFVSSEPGGILPGEDWLAQVRLALESAKIVIPLLTRQSFTRPWVNFETGAAWLANKKIIPAWCEEQVDWRSLPKPYVDWQIVHLPERADELRQAVETALGVQPSPTPRTISPTAFSELREAFKGSKQRAIN